ncbi:uncharacterized protein [Zea mays]|uniref:uncharacterized protein isoform X2 n=1 Tax=Zea mays TaxID=4577 RepID=UPI0004DE9BBD|nr:uncharacterized protein LOC103653605 isoform X2 [Zea mays]|eukprot:XP_023158122.1 uncharacterized protein LOC103653605 isoform X2 [Zea mays]
MPVHEPYPSAVLDEQVHQMLHNSRAELDAPSAASSLQGVAICLLMRFQLQNWWCHFLMDNPKQPGAYGGSQFISSKGSLHILRSIIVRRRKRFYTAKRACFFTKVQQP